MSQNNTNSQLLVIHFVHPIICLVCMWVTAIYHSWLRPGICCHCSCWTRYSCVHPHTWWWCSPVGLRVRKLWWLLLMRTGWREPESSSGSNWVTILRWGYTLALLVWSFHWLSPEAWGRSIPIWLLVRNWWLVRLVLGRVRLYWLVLRLTSCWWELVRLRVPWHTRVRSLIRVKWLMVCGLVLDAAPLDFCCWDDGGLGLKCKEITL